MQLLKTVPRKVSSIISCVGEGTDLGSCSVEGGGSGVRGTNADGWLVGIGYLPYGREEDLRCAEL